MSIELLTVEVRKEHDVVLARQRGRQLAALLGFEPQDQTRIATAVSEIARNAFNYAGGGKVEFQVEGKTSPQLFLAVVRDQGPGIAVLKEVLDGRYRSPTGMGMGIMGARRLMDQFEIDSAPGRGTRVVLKKILPRKAPLVTPREVARIAERLAAVSPRSALEEVQEQNQELLRTLEELRRRQDDLVRLNQELEDTNRGVVALYAELDESADHLRRADELKSRFLSNMSHEFRTPVNSIVALSRLLLDRIDGPLSAEQEKQVSFIQDAAGDLLELINDLLDLAKVEAGKIEVHPIRFAVRDLFGALRGMLRPLLLNERVNLVFEEPEGIPDPFTDEGKVSQILRNFISNALKFTESGEVRVSAALDQGREVVVFSVGDTGIGIAPEDQETIFQEFTQLENPIQKKVRGTGLGLPLSRKLAQLLGGSLAVQSEPGRGSTFSARIPLHYREAKPAPDEGKRIGEVEPGSTPVLVVEDSPDAFFVYQRLLKGSRWQPLRARSLREARESLTAFRPAAIILDIQLKGEDTWRFLADLKGSVETQTIPIVVITSTDDPRKAMALGADVYTGKPVDRVWLLKQLGDLTRQRAEARILIIDDDQTSRYLIRALLGQERYEVVEATTGEEGIRLARESRPRVVFLDLIMPGMSGLEVLERLRQDPATGEIPVIIVTSKVLDGEERRRLSSQAAAVLSKESSSRAESLRQVRETLLRMGVAC